MQVEVLELVVLLLRQMPRFRGVSDRDVAGRAFADLSEFLQYRQAVDIGCNALLQAQKDTPQTPIIRIGHSMRGPLSNLAWCLALGCRSHAGGPVNKLTWHVD